MTHQRKNQPIRQGQLLFKHRGTLPVLVLVAGLCLYGYQGNHGSWPLSTEHSTWLNFGCLVWALVGLAIRVAAVGHSPKGTSGRNTHRQVADVLNTSGPYSLMRHPLYFGNFFLWSGVAMLTQNLWFVMVFVALFGWFYSRIIAAEEAFLAEKFGDAYSRWQSKTPAFIPKFAEYRVSIHTFNWKKVIRKEKNGILAIFGCFLLFRVSAQLATSGFDFPAEWWHENAFWWMSFALAVVYYVLVKLMMKYTRWLYND